MDDDYDDDDVAFFICGTQKGWRFCFCPRSQSIHCFVVCIRMLLLLNTRHRKLHILTKTSIQRKQNSVARSAKPTLSALLRHLHEEVWKGGHHLEKSKRFSRIICLCLYVCVSSSLSFYWSSQTSADQLSERSLSLLIRVLRDHNLRILVDLKIKSGLMSLNKSKYHWQGNLSSCPGGLKGDTPKLLLNPKTQVRDFLRGIALWQPKDNC